MLMKNEIVISPVKKSHDCTVPRGMLGNHFTSPCCGFLTVDYAVGVSHGAVFTHSGQVCCAGTRTFVQEEIYDEFVRKSKELAEKRVVGDPYDAKTDGGPQVIREAVRR